MTRPDFDPASADAPSTYRAHFDESVRTLAIVLTPRKATGALLRAARGWVLSRHGVRATYDQGDDAKMIILCPAALARAGITDIDSVTCIDELPPALVQSLAPLLSDARENGVRLDVLRTAVNFTADGYTMEEILRRLLPPGVVVPSGFEQVGHIAHLNLSDDQLQYKHLIGQVLLDCNRVAGVRTVVNKLGIAAEFRELKLELLCGDNDMVAKVRQHGVEFTVPYDKVYWNSKLSREHDRLVSGFSANDTLFDVMAGVGPFVVPALRKGLRVFGNDLNPVAVDAMQTNVKRNASEAQRKRFVASCEDGRAFISRMRAVFLQCDCRSSSSAAVPSGSGEGGLFHFVLNLPALAVTFLDAFSGPEWLDTAEVTHIRTILVHCYCFSRSTEAALATQDAIEQCSTHLGHTLRPCDVRDVHVVRDVAPNKLMVCVSFALPSDIFDSGPAKRGPLAEPQC